MVGTSFSSPDLYLVLSVCSTFPAFRFIYTVLLMSIADELQSLQAVEGFIRPSLGTHTQWKSWICESFLVNIPALSLDLLKKKLWPLLGVELR